MLQNIGVKIKMVPGCGFGFGVFGILTKATVNPMSRLAPMAGVVPSRMPRAYPNNHIGRYSLFLSKAQAVITKSGGTSSSTNSEANSTLACDGAIGLITDNSSSEFVVNTNDEKEFTGFLPMSPISLSLSSGKRDEKIRMKFRCTMTQNYVCVTDSAFFVLNPTAEKIISKLTFKEIERISVRRCQIELSAKKKRKSIYCSTANDEKAQRIATFIKSQQFVMQMFKGSLLE